VFRFPYFTVGISQQMLQQVALGGAMIALPIFPQRTPGCNALQAGPVHCPALGHPIWRRRAEFPAG
jgi:hypothetical protein